MAKVVVVFDREIERNRVGLLLREVCAVLCAVEDDEEHVSRSECAVPISAGGKDWTRVCTWSLACTNQSDDWKNFD